MTSPAKQPPKKSGGWGSLLSGAVANLESRLDTILADDPEASAKERAAAQARKEALGTAGRPRGNSGSLGQALARASEDGPRDGSRTRGNDRLAERLAKATAPKTGSQNASGLPSRVASPALDPEGARSSIDSRRSLDVGAQVAPELSFEQQEPKAEEDSQSGSTGTLQASGLPINPARKSLDSTRLSLEVANSVASAEPSSRTSVDLTNGNQETAKSEKDLLEEVARLKAEHEESEKQRQEEMHLYMEKIDALQTKLQYLAKETVAAAKEANASSNKDANTTKLAEKDERIALLMEEGEKLSKAEMRHLQTIKKLRAKTADEDKAMGELRKRLDRAERAESELKQKVRRAETAQRQAEEKSTQIAAIEKQVGELQTDRENASELVRALTVQLKEAKDKAEQVEKEAANKAAEIDRGKITKLENDLQDSQIEKKLAEDRAAAEIKKLREELIQQQDRFSVRELELKSEISGLDSRLEVMRARAEEASSEGSTDGGTVKLLRQVETLQSQYALAKGNWETIEGSLNARISTLENDRDEIAKRESDLRKKHRDLGVRSRKVEDELESVEEKHRTLTQEAEAQRETIKDLQAKLARAESGLDEAKADFERQRKLWETETAERIEEEKAKWQKAAWAQPGRPESPSINRKLSGFDTIGSQGPRKASSRFVPHDIFTDPSRPVSRRSSILPTPSSRGARSPQPPSVENFQTMSPAFARADSMETPMSASIPPTPSVERDADFGSNSPQQTINDLVSTSTAGAGPSVQLVERLSQAVRRLESEKATFKDELARLSAQRDDARNEVVSLMREVETKRAEEAADLQRRYTATLELLGEREEQVDELKQDLTELKALYKELADEKFRP